MKRSILGNATAFLYKISYGNILWKYIMEIMKMLNISTAYNNIFVVLVSCLARLWEKY